MVVAYDSPNAGAGHLLLHNTDVVVMSAKGPDYNGSSPVAASQPAPSEMCNLQLLLGNPPLPDQLICIQQVLEGIAMLALSNERVEGRLASTF